MAPLPPLAQSTMQGDKMADYQEAASQTILRTIEMQMHVTFSSRHFRRE